MLITWTRPLCAPREGLRIPCGGSFHGGSLARRLKPISKTKRKQDTEYGQRARVSDGWPTTDSRPLLTHVPYALGSLAEFPVASLPALLRDRREDLWEVFHQAVEGAVCEK